MDMSSQPWERSVEIVRVTCSMQGEKVQMWIGSEGLRAGLGVKGARGVVGSGLAEGSKGFPRMRRVRCFNASHGAGRSRKIAEA